MTKELQKIKRQIIPILKKAGVKKTEIFGSFARGDFNKRSDVDLIVHLGSKMGLFEFVKLKEDLEKKLGRRVDMITPKSIHKLLRPHINRDKQKIY